jgi:hypothetical protein
MAIGLLLGGEGDNRARVEVKVVPLLQSGRGCLAVIARFIDAIASRDALFLAAFLAVFLAAFLAEFLTAFLAEFLAEWAGGG